MIAPTIRQRATRFISEFTLNAKPTKSKSVNAGLIFRFSDVKETGKTGHEIKPIFSGKLINLLTLVCTRS